MLGNIRFRCLVWISIPTTTSRGNERLWLILSCPVSQLVWCYCHCYSHSRWLHQSGSYNVQNNVELLPRSAFFFFNLLHSSEFSLPKPAWKLCSSAQRKVKYRCWLSPDNNRAVQIPCYVFALTEIEYLHVDLGSNERRMVVSQQQDFWRRIPFLGATWKSSRNQPSCSGLINSLLNS